MNKLVFLEVVISTLVLMSGAFYNEFPLITGDSAIYISSGFDGIVPSERPIFYGWFIRFFRSVLHYGDQFLFKI